MDNWNHIIQAGVAPIIVISACGLLCLAFYNRLAAVVGRLRAFHREQLQAADAQNKGFADNDEVALVRCQELLGMLSVQIAHVTRRARLLRRVLGCLLMSVAVMAACSIGVGLATLAPAFVYVAVPLFVLGLLLLIAAASLAMLELKYAVDPVELEGRFIEQLNGDLKLDLAEVSAAQAAEPQHDHDHDHDHGPATSGKKRPCNGKDKCSGKCCSTRKETAGAERVVAMSASASAPAVRDVDGG